LIDELVATRCVVCSSVVVVVLVLVVVEVVDEVVVGLDVVVGVPVGEPVANGQVPSSAGRPVVGAAFPGPHPAPPFAWGSSWQ
jgi:hypothetical protein